MQCSEDITSSCSAERRAEPICPAQPDLSHSSKQQCSCCKTVKLPMVRAQPFAVSLLPRAQTLDSLCRGSDKETTAQSIRLREGVEADSPQRDRMKRPLLGADPTVCTLFEKNKQDFPCCCPHLNWVLRSHVESFSPFCKGSAPRGEDMSQCGQEWSYGSFQPVTKVCLGPSLCMWTLQVSKHLCCSRPCLYQITDNSDSR